MRGSLLLVGLTPLSTALTQFKFLITVMDEWHPKLDAGGPLYSYIPYSFPPANHLPHICCTNRMKPFHLIDFCFTVGD